jgi:hypothetical protein
MTGLTLHSNGWPNWMTQLHSANFAPLLPNKTSQFTPPSKAAMHHKTKNHNTVFLP